MCVHASGNAIKPRPPPFSPPLFYLGVGSGSGRKLESLVHGRRCYCAGRQARAAVGQRENGDLAHFLPVRHRQAGGRVRLVGDVLSVRQRRRAPGPHGRGHFAVFLGGLGPLAQSEDHHRCTCVFFRHNPAVSFRPLPFGHFLSAFPVPFSPHHLHV